MLTNLQHPNIVRSYGSEQDGRLIYLLMDYVDGSTLRQEIFEKNQPLEASRILEVMWAVCSALHYAHSQGLCIAT
jgi:serine/threonine protein kinase